MPLIGNLDGIRDLPGSHHPFRQFDADLAGAEDRAIGLLQDQAKAQVASSVSSGRL